MSCFYGVCGTVVPSLTADGVSLVCGVGGMHRGGGTLSGGDSRGVKSGDGLEGWTDGCIGRWYIYHN